MSSRKRYLFGGGQHLRENMTHVQGGGAARPIYTIGDAKRVIRPKVIDVAAKIKTLPNDSCPSGEVVVGILMHPKHISKSSFPESLIDTFGLRVVGDRAVHVSPRLGEPAVTTEFHVAGSPAAFKALGNVTLWNETSTIAGDLVKVEDWFLIPPTRKIKSFNKNQTKVILEAAIYGGRGPHGAKIIEAFQQFLIARGASARIDERIDVAGLSFVAVEATPEQVEEIATFQFLRLIRGMPHMRIPNSNDGDDEQAELKIVSLPTLPPRDPSLRVAILDGGIVERPELKQYVTLREPAGIGPQGKRIKTP